MTIMSDALKRAGVKRPTSMEVVLRSIADQPGIDLSELFKKHHQVISYDMIHKCLKSLVERGMAYYKEERPDSKRPKRPKRMYYTDVDLTQPYKLMPVIKGPLTTQAAPAAPTIRQNVDLSKPLVPDEIIDSMTVKEARELYIKLKRMFNG